MKTRNQMFQGRLATALVALTFLQPFRIAAANLLVYNTSNSGAGSLRQAIMDNNALAGGNTIIFSNVVTGTITLTTGELLISKNVTIIGPGTNVLAVNGNHASRIFRLTNTVTVALSGLTITNGFAGGDDPFLDILGGGIFNDHSTLMVSNCFLSGSSASVGGGIYNYGRFTDGASLTVIGSTLSGNSAVFNGGGIYNSASEGGTGTVTVIGSTLKGNSANNYGGGIYNDGENSVGATVKISGSTLSGNSSEYGGGVFNIGFLGIATVTVSASSVSSNSASYSGGGIFTDAEDEGSIAILTVSNSSFSGNSAVFYGGGINNDGAGGEGRLAVSTSTFSNNSAQFGASIDNNGGNNGDATLTVSNCTFTGNAASNLGGGGGIYNHGQSGGSAVLTIHASTFSGNSGHFGGGIYNDGTADGSAPVTIIACTFSTNSAQYGGGIYSDSATQTVIASTFSGDSIPIAGLYNTAGKLQIGGTIMKAGAMGVNIYNFGGTVISSGHNLSSDNGGGFLTGTSDQINTDPLLGPLQDNGGPTFTMALLTGSPAIDKGKSFGLTTDQRGAARSFDFGSITNAIGGDGSDIGAFELQLHLPLLDITRNGGNVMLSWSTNDTGFTLEYRTNLNPGFNWSNVPVSPAIVGSRYAVTNPATTGNKFYRLRSP